MTMIEERVRVDELERSISVQKAHRGSVSDVSPVATLGGAIFGTDSTFTIVIFGSRQKSGTFFAEDSRILPRRSRGGIRIRGQKRTFRRESNLTFCAFEKGALLQIVQIDLVQLVEILEFFIVTHDVVSHDEF